ncbi:alanine--tRNA ligase [Caniella muris]|uniref:alanine--tRNA ligase n=1 Tax=Caniella muris TaxID=2941502 RepID=UPI0020405E4C|nr:alanine--tRNA ligase [Caniella muris]
MTTAEIRSSFLDFFEAHGCKRFPSSSLVPDDPSLLLANAGMNQFKQYYLGTKTLKDAIGATSCQKCLRTNDIDAIGLDGRHLSFFEMLGNFAFGGYSKRQACEWAFDFIVNHLHLPLDRLYFTVFTDDDDCAAIWESLGVDPGHISRLGEDDNFWAAGPTGPCGPCSEIYFDQGEEHGCGSPDCAPGCDCDRFLEFWNLVFTQYDRQEDGTLVDLPHQNVDTGMGLERMAAIMQHKSSNYDGDILWSLIELGERLSGATYGEEFSKDVSLRIIADHSRAVTFMIGDGILPSNEGRGYVLRRLLRRAVFHGRLLGIEDAFLCDYVAEVTRLMGDTYPELVENAALIEGTVRAEEARFSSVIETGRLYLEGELERLAEGETLSGHVAFTLHDTYGFPVDLTREIALGAGHDIDQEAFDADMEAQRSRARAAGATDSDAWSQVDVWTALSDSVDATEFHGYEEGELRGCTVLSIVRDGESVMRAETGDDVEVVLDRTPFYAEMGGEVGDTGELSGIEFRMDVDDTVSHDGLTAHVGRVKGGFVRVGDIVTAEVDERRRELIRRNHTATHLLDAALKRVLGDHVHQAGSLVAPDRLRFDFTHFEALTQAQVQEIEGLVNEQIFLALPVTTELMSIEDAKASGAVALFGEKYGDEVRVVRAGEGPEPFSAELCGGLHASNTAELGIFKIVSEGSVGSAARRIEAVTSLGALDFVNGRLDALDAAAASLKSRPASVAGAVDDMLARERDLKAKLKRALSGAGANAAADALADAIQCDGYRAVVTRLDGRDARDLRGVWDTLREQAKGPVACFLVSQSDEGKVSLLAAGTKEAVEAGFDGGAVVKAVTGAFGGRGGGKPAMAQGGLPGPAVVADALDAVRERLGQGK